MCNLYAQKGAGPGPPELLWDAFVGGLRGICRFAQANDATVHVARLHHGIPGMEWPKVHAALLSEVAAHGVDVLVYTKDRADRATYGDAPHRPTTSGGDSSPAPSTGPSPPKPQKAIPAAALPTPAPNAGEARHAAPAGNVGAVLRGVNLVISGYSAADTADLSTKIAKLGGTVQGKWKSWGAASHLLVCETLTQVCIVQDATPAPTDGWRTHTPVVRQKPLTLCCSTPDGFVLCFHQSAPVARPSQFPAAVIETEWRVHGHAPRTRTSTRTRTHPCMHTQTHAHMLAHTYARNRAIAHTHTQIWPEAWARGGARTHTHMPGQARTHGRTGGRTDTHARTHCC